MTIEADLFSTLKTLVANRVYPDTLIQPTGQLPTWPAIRYEVISQVPAITMCGDSGDDAPDVRVQVDLITRTKAEQIVLRAEVLTAMLPFFPPAIYQDTFYRFDPETKTFQASMDYIIYKSSHTGSP